MEWGELFYRDQWVRMLRGAALFAIARRKQERATMRLGEYERLKAKIAREREERLRALELLRGLPDGDPDDGRVRLAVETIDDEGESNG